MSNLITWRRGPDFGTTNSIAGASPAIVLWNPKDARNVGMVVRLASCYGFKQVWSCGSRVAITAHGKDERLPREERMRGYADVTLVNAPRPLDHFSRRTAIVGVEFVDNAEQLQHFEHPADAAYVFGPEDGSLPVQARTCCWRFVQIPTMHCLNLATAVATILYDRATKNGFSEVRLPEVGEG